MSKKPRFDYRKTSKGWLVNVPGSVSDTGRFRRRYFKTRDEAKEECKRLKAVHDGRRTKAIDIRASLAEEAISAEALLKPLGVSLLDAVSRFVEAEKFRLASVTIEKAVEAFKKANRSGEKQAKAYRLQGEKLVDSFEGRMLSTITGEELEAHLENTTGGPGAFNQNLRLVRAIWRWAAKPPRKWCEEDPVKHIETQEAVSGEIGTLTPSEVAKLMRAAESYFPEAVPAFAIALFTGMRQAEISRLVPGDITDEGIRVPAVSAKTKRRRFIQMPKPLAAWLKVYPVGKSIVPTDWARKERAVRRLAGFRVWSGLVERLDIKPKLEASPPSKLPKWPENALRHTAATVAVAMGKPLEQLVFEHGHTGGLEMLRRHYIGAMPKADALAIWSTGPKGTKLSNIEAA